MNTSERILVHGPCIRDITDLLYFDKIAYPVLVALFGLTRSILAFPFENPGVLAAARFSNPIVMVKHVTFPPNNEEGKKTYTRTHESIEI